MNTSKNERYSLDLLMKISISIFGIAGLIQAIAGTSRYILSQSSSYTLPNFLQTDGSQLVFTVVPCVFLFLYIILRLAKELKNIRQILLALAGFILFTAIYIAIFYIPFLNIWGFLVLSGVVILLSLHSLIYGIRRKRTKMILLSIMGMNSFYISYMTIFYLMSGESMEIAISVPPFILLFALVITDWFLNSKISKTITSKA